jgi:hypothetical protein
MPAAPVILNNTPLVALYVLERLDILRDLFDEVGTPSPDIGKDCDRRTAGRRTAPEP